jgi:hypothetical protein
MLGAGGRFGGNAARVSRSRLGAGMVRLLRIRNAHKGPKAKGSSRDLEPLGEPGPLAQSGAKVSLARLIPSSRFCSECFNGALAKPIRIGSEEPSHLL